MGKSVRRKSYRRKVRKTQVQRKRNLKSKRSKRSKRSKKYTKKKQRGGDYGKALIAGLISLMLLGGGFGLYRYLKPSDKCSDIKENLKIAADPNQNLFSTPKQYRKKLKDLNLRPLAIELKEGFPVWSDEGKLQFPCDPMGTIHAQDGKTLSVKFNDENMQKIKEIYLNKERKERMVDGSGDMLQKGEKIHLEEMGEGEIIDVTPGSGKVAQLFGSNKPASYRIKFSSDTLQDVQLNETEWEIIGTGSNAPIDLPHDDPTLDLPHDDPTEPVVLPPGADDATGGDRSLAGAARGAGKKLKDNIKTLVAVDEATEKMEEGAQELADDATRAKLIAMWESELGAIDRVKYMGGFLEPSEEDLSKYKD
tara:strand:+ start:105 stop:1199 length:1095 start_codon:yes stop_codon:yes gene_type:complete